MKEFEIIKRYIQRGESDMYDVTEVGKLVRCKDCKHFQYAIRSNGWGECDLGVFGRHFVEEEWYCSMGERKDVTVETYTINAGEV